MAIHSIIFEALDGTPIIGLTPLITIFRDAQTGAAVTPIPTVTENGDGFYVVEHDTRMPVEIVVDGGAQLTDPRERYRRGVLQPTDAAVQAAQLEEILDLLREDLVFEEISGDTFMTLYKNGVALRRWQATDHLGRDVVYPSSSQLPVNRTRVL